MYKKSEKMHAIRQGLEQGNCLGVAIRNAGMKSYDTIERWRKERPMIDRYFAKCVNKMEGRRIDSVVDALFKNALTGNVAACAFYLKNKAGWKDAFDHKGEGFGDTKIILVRDAKENQAKDNGIKLNTIPRSLPIQQ